MKILSSPIEGGRLVQEKLKARSSLIALHAFPCIKDNFQKAECFTANYFIWRKKTKLMNLGKENSLLAILHLSYSLGILCFNLPD